MVKVYNIGEIIYEGKPFAKVVYHSERYNFCDNCFKGASDFQDIATEFKLKVCVICRYVGYCDKKCQKRAWKEHKVECTRLKNLPEERRDFTRLLGQVILKTKGKEWSSFKEYVGGVEKSFEDIESNCEVTRKDPKLCLYGLEMMRILKEYLGQDHLPDDDKILELIGKVKHSRYGIAGKGTALYIGASFFQHSCIPNAVRWFDGSTIIIRASTKKTPRRNVNDVTISYPRMIDCANRFVETRKSLWRGCQCLDCRLPYGESALTKVLDRTRAYSIIQCTELALERLNSFAQLGGDELDEEQSEVLQTVLTMQEDVLGDTNILRIRLLAAKAYYEKDVEAKEKDLLKVVTHIEETFGRSSEELIWVFQELAQFYMTRNNIPACHHFYEKLQRLKRLLYGIPIV